MFRATSRATLSVANHHHLGYGKDFILSRTIENDLVGVWYLARFLILYMHAELGATMWLSGLAEMC